MWVPHHVSTCPTLVLCVFVYNISEPVCSFVDRTKVDTVKRKYELLTPSPGKLPSRVAIVGSVEWIEGDD